MTDQIDIDDPEYREAARQMPWQHDQCEAFEAEMNVTSELWEERRADVGVTIVWRELRAWLRESAEGRAVEEAVGRLLGGG